MPAATVPTLLSVLAVSVLSFTGAAVLALGPARLKKVIPLLVALAAGALLGGALLHLLPEAFAHGADFQGVGWSVLAGLLGFFLVESFVHWHHHGEESDHHHHHGEGRIASFAWMNLVGDGVHNFIDGALIAGTWMLSPQAGVVTTVAVALHEIPQEFGDFGVLLHGGMPARKALLLNAASAATAFAGALVVLIAGPALHLDQVLVPFAAGGFIYIACADLVPELHRQARGRQVVPLFLALALGIGLVTGLPKLLGVEHTHTHGPACDCDDHAH